MSPSLSPDYRRKWVELQLQYLLEHEVRSYDIWLIFLSLTESRLHSTHRVNLSYVKTWSCTWKCHSHVFNVPNTRNITDFPRCNQRSRLPSGNLHVLINAAQYDYEFSGNFVFTLVCPLLVRCEPPWRRGTGIFRSAMFNVHVGKDEQWTYVCVNRVRRSQSGGLLKGHPRRKSRHTLC